MDAALSDGIRGHLARAAAPAPDRRRSQADPRKGGLVDVDPIDVASIDSRRRAATHARMPSNWRAAHDAQSAAPSRTRLRPRDRWPDRRRLRLCSVGKDGEVSPERDCGACATAIYFEARGEDYRGQVAVGQVVMNRAQRTGSIPRPSAAWSSRTSSQRNACQFSFACDGIPETITEPKAWAQGRGDRQRASSTATLYLTEVG